jgi:hypothetical protein
MNDDGWTVFFSFSCVAISIGLLSWMLGASSCNNMAQNDAHDAHDAQYAVYATIHYNRVDSVRVSEIRATLVKDFPGACLVTMAVDTLRGDSVFLSTIEDLIATGQDTVK